MTVKDLIDALAKLDPALPLGLDDSAWGIDQHVEIKEQIVDQDMDGEAFYPTVHNFKKCIRVRAVILSSVGAFR